MRLINNETLVMEEFMGGGSQLPKYAILSHTWEGGEVTLQDFTHPDEKLRSQKKGYAKVLKTCELAKSSGIQYSWVDTCCIDKTSSAELTEAINSMFQWYKGAVVCYVWLADLATEHDKQSLLVADSPLRDCRWFTRGWTLQELIAPDIVEFYDREWNMCGTKMDLCEPIIDITKISVEVLQDPRCLPRFSVAQRMSWASTRETTRMEDMAYCLLGIFDVNMPMLYGEGDRAFLRLQEEIAKNTNDLSLLAWKTGSGIQTYHGIFAANPAAFRDSGSIKLISDTVFNPEFSITNKGLKIQTDISTGTCGHYYMHLKCSTMTEDGSQQVGIRIMPRGGGVYARVFVHEFAPISASNETKSTPIFLFKTISKDRSRELEVSHSNGFTFRKGFNEKGNVSFPEFPFEASRLGPVEEWDSQRRMFITQGANEFTGYCFFNVCKSVPLGKALANGSIFLVVFGITQGEDEPWTAIATPYDGSKLFQHLNNEKLLAQAALQRRQYTGVLMRNGGHTITHQVTVSLEKVNANGQNMYCIDLVYEEETENNYREDVAGSLSRMWKKKD